MNNLSLEKWSKTASPFLLRKIKTKKPKDSFVVRITKKQHEEFRRRKIERKRIAFENSLKNKCRNKKHRIVKEPESYESYLSSLLWKNRKERYYSTHSKLCSKCGTKSKIHLHHVVYSKRGAEKDKHLAPLCDTHHSEFHDRFSVKGNMTKEMELFLL